MNPAPAPQRAPLRAGVARCGGGGRASPGGVPSTVVRGAWCQALSLPRPPVLWSGQPGFRDPCVPGAVGGRVDPAPAPQRAPLRAGVARCGGGGRASPGGVPSTVVGGAWCQALSLPRPPVLWSGQPGFRDPCVPGAVDAGVWTQHRPHSVRPCGPTLLAVGVAEGRPRRGVPSTVVRGAWCQALSLPRPPVLRSVQPGFRDPRVPGAVGAGVGTQHRPHSVRPCGPALLAVGVAEGRPRGGVPSTIVRGAWCQALSLPRLPVLWSGQPGFRDPCVPGAVDAGVWTQHRPYSVRPCGPALLAVGVAEGRPRGGGAFHRCEGRLVSGAVPPPAARPPERAARVPRPACPGRGRCGRGDPAPAPQRAPLRAGVARCGGGGRASPGGVPSTIVRGAWGQALSLSRLPAHCWVGCRGSFGVCGVCGVCAVRVVVRGAALPLVLRCSPLRCLGAVLCSPCARRVPSPVRAPCSFAGYPLFLSRLRCSLPFPLPLSLACTFSLPPLCCVSLSFSLSARASSFEPA